MFWWLLGSVIVLAMALIAAVRMQRRGAEFEKAAVAVQALATSAALLFAGYWYLYDRKGQPHANTRLAVVGIKVAPDAVALEARFTLTNLGSTLLEIGQTDVRLQQMNVGSMPIDRLLALDRRAFPDRIAGRDVYDDGVLMWPMIRQFRGGKPREVEPGESDLRVVDMIASCRETALRVLFMMQRPGSTNVWSDQVSIGLAALCAQPIGSREVWSNAKPDE